MREQGTNLFRRGVQMNALFAGQLLASQVTNREVLVYLPVWQPLARGYRAFN